MMKLIILFILFLLTNCAIVQHTVLWTGGHCNICGSTPNNYACSNEHGNWQMGRKYFNNTIPPNNLITKVTVDLYGEWGCGGSSSNVTLYLVDDIIQSKILTGQCSCGQCDPIARFETTSALGSYIYNGINYLRIQVLQPNVICLSKAVITLNYTDGLQQINPPLNCDSFGGCVHGTCVISQNSAPYCNCTKNYYGPNCQCYVPSEHLLTDKPPVLDVSNSGFKVKDTMFLFANTSVKYFDTKIEFKNSLNNTCDYPKASDSVDWITGFNENKCENYMVGRIPWRTAWPTCVFKRIVEPNWLSFKGEMIVTSFENLGAVSPSRPTPIIRKITSVLPFVVRFPRSVTIQTTPVTVYSFVDVFGSITEQQFVSNENAPPGTATIKLLTSVQKEYYLSSPITIEGPNGFAVAINGNPNVGGTCSDDGSVCEQLWTITILPQNNKCDFNGVYRANYTIKCKPSVQSNCPLDSNTNKVSIVFTLTSSNLCAQVIDDIDISGYLTTYGDQTHQTPKDDFILNQYVYFKTSLNSNKATITKATVTKFSVKLWDESVKVLHSYGMNTQNGNDLDLDVVNNVNNQPTCHLKAKMNPQLFNIGQDTLQNVEFYAEIDVEYDNTQKRSISLVFGKTQSFGTSVQTKLSKVSSGSITYINLFVFVALLVFIF